VQHRQGFAVATCADRGMLPAACCALLSVRNNLRHPASLILVSVDTDAEARAAVDGFSRRHGLQIAVHDFSGADLPQLASGRWPPSVLTRLFLDRIVPPGIGRLLYIDADTLAVDALDPLAGLALGGLPAAAVEDYIMAFPAKLQARRAVLGMTVGSPYFNSGVMLMDWPQVLEGDLLGQARAHLDRTGQRYHATDQDALNAAFENRWARLDPRWNTQTGFLPDITRPAIMHFTGRRKPWQKGAPWQYRRQTSLYREWLAGTTWQGIVPDEGRLGALASLARYQGKRFEELRKARRVSAYLRMNQAGRIGGVQKEGQS
jgi:lipopolysaccharide biosynthesis glycosyltransferase